MVLLQVRSPSAAARVHQIFLDFEHAKSKSRITLEASLTAPNFIDLVWSYGFLNVLDTLDIQTMDRVILKALIGLLSISFELKVDNYGIFDVVPLQILDGSKLFERLS